MGVLVLPWSVVLTAISNVMRGCGLPYDNIRTCRVPKLDLNGKDDLGKVLKDTHHAIPHKFSSSMLGGHGWVT